MDSASPPHSFVTRGGATAARALALSALLLSGCARNDTPDDKQVRLAAETRRGRYVLLFRATRLKDQAPLAQAEVPVVAGQQGTLRRKPPAPTEETPVFTRFSAALSATRTPGVLQLVTKATIREAARNKKGKLKFSERNQGALLPVRPGETQLASVPTDPVQINVRLARP